MGPDAPEVFDHTLIRLIGEGAFGQVWLARNAIGTYRAVKVVKRDSAPNTSRFEREFKGIQRFEPVSRLHDGLIDVLQVGRAADDGYFYYVMELGDDLDLRQEFSPANYEPRTLDAEFRKRTRILAPEAALIGAQLAAALGFMHDSGLIHQDIKPSNILFVRGLPKIGDPGLVGMIEGSMALGGTPGYIPPEGPGTARADIFSLGKLLYVITTAKQPSNFPQLPLDMMTYEDAAHLRRLNAVIVRACAYKPEERYASAEDFRKDLLEVHAGGSPAETRRRLRAARRVGVVLAVLLLLVGGAYYRAVRQARLERTRLAQSYSDAAIRQLTGNDALGALPFLAAVLQADPENRTLADLTKHRISFAWRYSPRLLAQTYFDNTVNWLQFEPKKQNLAIATSRGEVWRWNYGNRAPPLLVGRHGTATTPFDAKSVSFSSNGSWLASAGLDGVANFWNLTEPAAPPRSHPVGSAAYSVAFLPDGRRAAVGCENGSVVLVGPNGDQTVTIRLGSRPIRCLACKPDGSRLLAGDEAGFVYEANLTSGQLLQSSKLAWVYDVAYNRNGSQTAAAAGNRGYVNPLAPQPLARIRHPAIVSSVCFDPIIHSDGEHLLTSCFDNIVRLWSCSSEEEIMFPIHTDTQPTQSTFSPDGQTFAVATDSGLVRVYGFPPAAEWPRRAAACASSDSTRYAWVEQDTNVVVFDSSSQNVLATLRVAGGPVERLQLDRTGRRLLLRQNPAKEIAHFEVWEIPNHLLGSTNVGRKVEAEFSPEGDCVGFRQTNTLGIWQPITGTWFSYPWALNNIGEAEIRLSSRSQRLAAVWSTNVLILSTTDGSTVAQWSRPHDAVTVDFDPGGRIEALGESPPGLAVSTNWVWNIGTRTPVSPPLVLLDGCFLARFNAAGTWLLLADESKTSILCPTSTWTPLPRTMRHLGILTEAAFSHDDRFVATLSGYRQADGIPAVQIWDLASAEPVTPALRISSNGSGRVYFLAGAQRVLVATENGYGAIWDLEKLAAAPRDLQDLAELLSCQRLTTTGETRPIRSVELNALWQKLTTTHPDWFKAPAR